MIITTIFFLILGSWLSAAIFEIKQDISNLYESRDRLWKELTKLQQTAKRRDKLQRQRIHNLERKLCQVQKINPDTRNV